MEALKRNWVILVAALAIVGYMAYRDMGPRETGDGDTVISTADYRKLGKQYARDLQDAAKSTLLYGETSSEPETAKLVQAMRTSIDEKMATAWRPIADRIELDSKGDVKVAKQLLGAVAKGMP